VTGHFVSLWLSRQTGDGASYRLIYSLGVFLTHTSPRRARLNYGRDADAVKPLERFLPGWEAALGSHPGARGPGGQRAGAALLTPAEMRLAPRWAISGPGVDGGWARLGSMGEPGRSHLPLPPIPASPEPTLISTGVGEVVGIRGGARWSR